MKLFMWWIALCFVLSGVLFALESNNTTESNEEFTENAEDMSWSCPYNSCSDNASDSANRFDRACMCDKDCIKYGDCCYDSEYYNRIEQQKPSLFECQTITYSNYLVMSTCASSWNDEKVVTKCAMSRNHSLFTEDIELQTPATSTVTNITYGNIFCALCNYEEDNLQLWSITIENFCVSDNINAFAPFPIDVFNSTKNPQISSIFYKQLEDPSSLQFDGNRWYIIDNKTSYYCDLTLVPPDNVQLEYCDKTSYFVSSCPKNWTDSDLLDQCNGPYSRIFDYRGYTFKNKYCAYCNGRNDSQLVCAIITPYISRTGSIIEISLNGHRPFAVLFDFKSKRNSKVCSEENESYAKLKEQMCPKHENNTIRHENWFFTNYTTIAVLTSLVFLILHLAIFSVVKELHTIGGKNIASFSVALVLAYSSFLFGNYAKGQLCSAIAVIMYYSFLSSFSWTLTISYDMWQTFWNATKKFRSPRNPQKTFFIYSLWSWSVPFIPLVIAVYMDLFEDDYMLAPHFGDNGCWFENGYSLLVFFVAPVCVIIIVNFCLFLHTASMLHNAKCESVNQKSRVDFKLYARIALLTGFTWITGFVAGYTQKLVAWFIFILLNTAQGVLIFTAFSCKKRIILSFLKRIGKFEGWQESLQQSNVKSKDTVYATLNSVAKNT